MNPYKMTTVIDRTRYDTEKATLLCGDDYWDGHNFERRGRNQFLYRSPGGKYFFQYLTQWQGEQDSLQPCTQDEAIKFFESCREDDQRVHFETAFPGVEVRDA